MVVWPAGWIADEEYMLAPPPQLDTTALVAALRDGWAIGDPVLDYLPVGFGSHHWWATGRDEHLWFVRSMSTATPARSRICAVPSPPPPRCTGMPGSSSSSHRVSTADGGVIRVLQDGRFTVAVTPWIDAAPLGHGEIESVSDRAEVLRMLDRLHSARPRIEGTLPPDVDLALPAGDNLVQALDDLDDPWAMGPYAEATRELLRADQDRVRVALARYDDLETTVRAGGGGGWVVTHGEPHSANVLRGKDGTLHLIDWDTVRLAPRERDLWMVIEPTTDLHLRRTISRVARR